MAQHKAPTAVTFAPTHEKGGLALAVEQYWKPAALVAAALSVGLLWWVHKKEAHREESDMSWEALMNVATEDSRGGLSGSPQDLLAIDQKVRETQAGPWALYIAATSAASLRDYASAKESLKRLRVEYPNHPLVVEKYGFDSAEEAVSAIDQLERRLNAQEAWSQSHSALFANPDLPADAPRVRLNTDRGAIVVGLYSMEAPKHVENFLKLVKEGYYTGTKFHRIRVGSFIQAGDPNSVQGDPSTWGQGGPDYKIDKEVNQLRHFSGVLSAFKEANEQQSSGSQFIITTGDAHQFDTQYVVFGRVLEGLDVVSKIEHGTLVSGADRPEDPVTIQSTEAL